MVRHFRREKHIFTSLFFLNEPIAADCRHSKACLIFFFHASDFVGSISKSCSPPKVDPILKLSNYKATTQKKLHMFSAQNSKCPRRFLKIDLDSIYAHVFYESLRSC